MFGSLFRDKSQMVPVAGALPGRPAPIPTAAAHAVNGSSLGQPAGAGLEEAVFGMGCFWGVERKFWQVPGVLSTEVGYGGGHTPNPTYEEVCTGLTGHNEVVRVVFDPAKVSFEDLLRVFWEGHDPTQGMRQGNDRGTQYRSGIYATSDAQAEAAKSAKAAFAPRLKAAGYGDAKVVARFAAEEDARDPSYIDQSRSYNEVLEERARQGQGTR